MRSLLFTLAAFAGAAFALPLEKRQAVNDGSILNYALTLEYLEAFFYQQALANYTEADFDAAGFSGVRKNIVQIGAHEQAHVNFLSSIPPLPNTFLICRCFDCCWDHPYSTLCLLLPRYDCNRVPCPCPSHRGVHISSKGNANCLVLV
jgi:Ferritin-like domain